MHCSNKNNQVENKKGILKHGLLMMICCALPIIALMALPLLRIKAAAFSSLAFFLCPLMHIGMIFMMRKSSNKESCHGENVGDLDSKNFNNAEIEKSL